jgi:hypothetical protein
MFAQNRLPALRFKKIFLKKIFLRSNAVQDYLRQEHDHVTQITPFFCN